MAARTGKAKLAAVIGDPVGHSLSPAIHEYWLKYYGIDGAYIPLRVTEEKFASCIQALRDWGFAGCNVTIPHKERAFEIARERDGAAEAVGAVNTLSFAGNAIKGYNTDAYGFLENLRAADALPPPGATALILGAGGAARAAVVALMGHGCREILVINRTLRRAEQLCAALRSWGSRGVTLRPLPWHERGRGMEKADLLVNATSLGMAGQSALELDLGPLPAAAAVTDIVYRPLRTPLLAQAEARGLRAVDGLGMLLHQAAPGFERWFGVRPEVTARLREHALSAMEEER